MKTAIVILNWNGKVLLEQFLPAMQKFSNYKNVEIYIADNNSSDDSMSFVTENYPTIKIIKNKQNGGYAKGYNDALKNIEADVYVLVNSDIEVTQNWLTPILYAFENEPDTAIIQPKILDYNNKLNFEYAGAGGGFIDELGYPFCRGRIFSSIESDKGQYDDVREIFWASGACFFIRAQVFWELRGFDEDYFAHQEEIDLCWRAQNLGKTIKYVGTSTVYHIGGATLNNYNPQKTFLNFRNSLFSIVKNIPEKKLIIILFVRLVLDGIAGIKFLVEFQPKHTFEIIKAHASFYKNFKKMYKKRACIKTLKKDYFNTKSILWNYYLLGNKTFNKN